MLTMFQIYSFSKPFSWKANSCFVSCSCLTVTVSRLRTGWQQEKRSWPLTTRATLSTVWRLWLRSMKTLTKPSMCRSAEYIVSVSICFSYRSGWPHTVSTGGEDRCSAVFRWPAHFCWPLCQTWDFQSAQWSLRQVSFYLLPISLNPVEMLISKSQCKCVSWPTGGAVWRLKWLRNDPSWVSLRLCNSLAETWMRSKPGSVRNCKRPLMSPTKTQLTFRYGFTLQWPHWPQPL